MSRILDGVSSKDGSKGPGVFDLTPHKIAVCHLIQVFAPPAQHSIPFPFQSVSHHNRLGLFLLSLTRACDDFVEPSLEELMNQIKAIGGEVNDWLCEQLAGTLSSLSSPDDLFNFFDKLRGVLSTPDGTSMDDDQIFLDPSSQLGVFLRCSILSFNLLTFEGVCHLLTNIGTYCNSADLPEEEDYDLGSEYDQYIEAADRDLEDDFYQNYGHEFEENACAGKSSDLNVCATRSTYGVAEDIEVAADSKMNHADDGVQSFGSAMVLNNAYKGDHQGFLRARWQVEGYLNAQADLLEKDAGLFPLNSFDDILNQIQKLAPELHRVQYLQYLNGLYHDDYLSALDNLHRYFDYSAGMEGIFGRSSVPSSEMSLGRYETALLCLGTMHGHFGHSKKALEALTEAVRISQQSNDDSCLAYTLSAICTILSEIGISSTAGVIGSPYSLGTSTGPGMPLSAEQQLLVLLRRSLKRADGLKLICLVAFNHLALAKFDLKHVKRPLLSFGPKTTTKLRTRPIDVCKELRLSSHVLSKFGLDGLLQPKEDGSFSTSWLKNLTTDASSWSNNLQKARSSLINDYDKFHFGAQPNPIPTSVLQLAGSSYLLKATSWEMYGSAPLVRINSLVHVTCFSDAASAADLSLAYAKLIQHLAAFKGYEEAFTALELAEKKFLPSSNIRMQLLRLQLLHERALHRGQLKLAQLVCDKFGALASSISGVDMEVKTEAGIRHARTLIAAKQFSQAAAVAHSLFCTCYKFNLQVENATVLLLLAEIYKKSGNAVLALPYALASLSYCQSFNLDLLEASASLTLAELWLSLGANYAKRASNLIYRTLPMILGHGGLELCARANITLAKCYLSDPSFSISDDPSSVLDPLNQAAEELGVLEYHAMASEAFYLIAMVYHTLGRPEEREEAAASFKKHVLALENPRDEDVSSVFPL